jgi:CheY-like chemotaxis protein
MMDGTIEVASEYGKGSIFTVRVKQGAVECPALGKELAAGLSNFSIAGFRKSAQANIVRTPMPYGHVLVVDDVETNLYVAKGLLSFYQLSIETANSGFAALDKVERGGIYDVIFMDHMMPLMDGIETTRKLRASGYKGVIIALTANALAGNEVMFKENGFDDFVSKPIDARQLNACLNTYIRDRHPEEAGKYQAVETKEQTGGASKELLAVFRRDAENAAAVLREAALNDDIKLFTTTAHAMKSALANIGEQELSEKAAALEKAGREGNRDCIRENTAGFVAALEALLAKIASREGTSIDSGGQQNQGLVEDTAFLTEQLPLLKMACEDYDDAAAYAVLERLQEKAWQKETAQMLKEIHDALFLNSDFEKVVRMIENVGQ